MTVTSMVVVNAQGVATEPFWPNGEPEVTVEFQSNSSGGYDVRGLDANNNQVFSGNLLTTQKDRFIAAINNGTAGTLIASNQNMVGGQSRAKPGDATADAVVVTGGDPGNGNGPKIYVVPLVASQLSVDVLLGKVSSGSSGVRVGTAVVVPGGDPGNGNGPKSK